MDQETVPIEKNAGFSECEVCEYPFRSKIELSRHRDKHNTEPTEATDNQKCGICGLEVSSNNDFRNHIRATHTSNFNCDQCDFQGSSKIILIKHTNLKHRAPEHQASGTFK